MSQPETLFKRRVLKDLTQFKKVWVLKSNERARGGVPDLLVSLSGLFVAIELKIDGEQPTPLQYAVLKNIQGSNAVAFYTTPAIWHTHLAMLHELTRA